MSATDECPALVAERLHDGSTLPTQHGWFSIYRFPWPWGVPFPKVTRCLFCGAKRKHGR